MSSPFEPMGRPASSRPTGSAQSCARSNQRCGRILSRAHPNQARAKHIRGRPIRAHGAAESRHRRCSDANARELGCV